MFMKSTVRQRETRADPTVYPVEEQVGEDLLQRWIVDTLWPLIAALFAKRGKNALVGADQFIYWEQYNPRKVVAPDLYVLPGVDPSTRVKAWKVWETGIVPSFALEVMSGDDTKDVELSPERYAELGAGEVIVFDPDWERRRDGVRFRLFRRQKRGLILVEATHEDRVYAKALGCWLRSLGEGDEVRLRVGLGKRGEELLPTHQELAQREAELAQREAERAQREEERAQEAEREIERLQLLLALRDK